MINDLYTFLSWESTEDQIQAVLLISSQHSVFQGHFPNKPVLPGAVMLQIIKELMEKKLKRTILLTHISQIKFLEMICPETDTEIAIMIQAKNNKFYAEIRKEEKICFKMDFTLS